MELPKKLKERIEKAGFTITKAGDDFDFQTYSPAGCDFHIEVSAGTLRMLGDEVYTYYENFDPSSEAYLWLDEEGHGKNGAPYYMGDVYEDMCYCESYILKLSNIIEKFIRGDE